MSISHYFHKAKKEAKTSKAKTLIEQFHETSKACSYGKISEQQAEQKMRQLLFKNGYPISDFDMAMMKAVQIKSMNGFPPNAFEPQYQKQNKTKKQGKYKTPPGFGNPFGFPVFKMPKQEPLKKQKEQPVPPVMDAIAMLPNFYNATKPKKQKKKKPLFGEIRWY